MTLLLLALKITVVFGLAGLVSLALRRGRAAARHLVWGLALVGALAVPALGRLSPSVALPLLPPDAAIGHDAASPAGIYTPPRAAVPETGARTASTIATTPVTAPIRGGLDPATALLWLWAAGAIAVSGLIGVSVVATHRLARRATPVLAGPMVDDLRQAADALGIRRPVRLLLGADDAMPMTWGARRPAVLLPGAAASWTSDRRRDVLLHELAHVRRLDWLTQLGARVASAVYWWHPLAWYAARRLREERELACDDLVLAHGAHPSDYAHHLLEIARGLRASRATALAGVAMARPSQLAGRLLAVLDGTRHRAGLSRSHAGWAAGVAAALLLPLGGLTLVAAQPEPKLDKTKTPAVATSDGWTANDASPPAAPVTLTAPPVWAGGTLCDWSNVGDARSSHSNIDDDRVTITIVVDGCELSIRSRGRVQFTDDERDVASLGNDAWFEIEERSRSNDRRRAEFDGRGGDVQRRWFVNGRSAEWNAEAAEWFQGALLVAFRRTSFQARERAARIYARGGARALLAEIEQLHSSTALTAYLEHYASNEEIGSDEARRIATLAGQRISSSSNLAHVLTTLLRNPRLDEATRAEIVQATSAINSSSERARVLVATSTTQPLTPRLADAVLTSAAGISSSSERARVLTTVGRALPAETPLPDTYVQAARGINSSGELARVLRDLLQRDRLTPERLRAVVAISGSIGSSSERASVLRAVAAQRPDAAVTRAAIDEAARIGSSGEKASVLVALAEAGVITTPDLRQAYVRAAESIGSRSERERALRAIGMI